MEDQTSFDLNRAVLAWKAELAGQPELSAENVRELETHLLESISAHQRSGINEQEAFAKAQQQLGSVIKICVEFGKDNLLRIWRDRVFWIAMGGFITVVIGYAVRVLAMRLAHLAGESLGEWAAVAMYSLVNITPILCAGLLLATGRIQLLYSRYSWLFARRHRLGIVGVLLIIVANLENSSGINALAIYELGFLGFALAMMPSELRAAARRKIEGPGNWRNSTPLWRDRLFWIALSQLVLGAWNQTVIIGANAYFQRPTEPRRWITFLAVTIFFAVWLIPMAAAGVALSKAWFSSFTRRLRSRSRVLVAAIVLLSINSCLNWWHYYDGWVPRPMPMTEWQAEMLYSSVTWHIMEFGFIAAMLWLAQPRQRISAGEAE